MWCSVGDEKSGLPTAQSVNCVTKDPARTQARVAALASFLLGRVETVASPAAGAKAE